MRHRSHRYGPIELTRMWEIVGSLYGGPDCDAAEQSFIRGACEEAGIPMGYGRVGRAPTVLEDDYLPPMFDRRGRCTD